MASTEIELPDPGIFSEFLSILFPIRCVHCGREGNWLCANCVPRLKPVQSGVCRRCGRPAAREISFCPECRGRDLGFARARAAFYFEGPARNMIHRLKYTGQRRLAGFMAALSIPAIGNLTEDLRGANLTYVPLHNAKQISRGYNQAGTYARALSRRLGVPLKHLLLKQHATTPQNRLDFDERRNNLVGSFKLRRGAAVSGQKVILVDDVYTTGATAQECTRILCEGLGVEVYIWTFARTVRRVSNLAGFSKTRIRDNINSGEGQK